METGKMLRGMIAILLICLCCPVAQPSANAINLSGGKNFATKAGNGVFHNKVYYGSTGAQVELAPDYSNSTAFVDSMFGKGVRDYNTYKSVVKQGYDVIFFSKEVQKIEQSFADIWFNRPASDAKPTDKAYINSLRDYIKNNGMAIYKPVIALDSMNADGVPVYAISGYAKNTLSSEADVREFLQLFLAGAHFVVIDSPQDSKGKKHYLKASLEDSRTKGNFVGPLAMNSHYTWALNIKGSYDYPDSMKKTAPEKSPFICVVLAGATAWSKPNSFVQMEGWPMYAMIYGSNRHNADYDMHHGTLWNISTYGMCPFSEKRATACFIADKNWNPQLQKDTIMPHYRGADTPQGWLNKSLIVVK